MKTIKKKNTNHRGRRVEILLRRRRARRTSWRRSARKRGRPRPLRGSSEGGRCADGPRAGACAGAGACGPSAGPSLPRPRPPPPPTRLRAPRARDAPRTSPPHAATRPPPLQSSPFQPNFQIIIIDYRSVETNRYIEHTSIETMKSPV